MPNKISFAFFGTPDLVIPILDELEKNSLLPSVVITGRDAPIGRKLVVTPPAPKVWAESRDIPVLQPERIDEAFIEDLKSRNLDLGVVVAYGKILPEALINAPKHGMLNVHYSLLPKYRGATPVESAILNNDTETGVVIQKMAFALDSGDVIIEQKTSIKDDEKARELRERLNEIAKKMLPEAMQEVVSGTARFTKQDDSEASYCKKIKKEDGLLDLNGEGLTNWLKFRAYFGWPSSYYFLENEGKQIRIKITDAEYKDGKFQILKVVPEGKNEMNYADFSRSL